ncbi:zinc-dependent metalloprotease [Halopenitus sp. H-Gu1]|uniref:zinc-dependent metalloprotease n=1 Tax=Halopenitus sp. H-Gu1 TaxID=3242697 RepID=UPI00359E43A5
MNLLRSVQAVADASGTGVVDWENAATAAKEGTDPGSLDLSAADREGYANDVQAARDRIRDVAKLEFDVPPTAQIQNRHHWIDANVESFRNVMSPIESHASPKFPGFSRIANTGTMSVLLGFLARNVLGQYDPLLLADDSDDDHGLYFVHPNIVAAATELDIGYPRFRRWIAFHEVAHAAEFGAAPWLSEYLESRMEAGVIAMVEGELDREAFRELDAAMTAVEGYAELVMDRAFDDSYADLRRKLDERRRSGGPITRVVRRLLGFGLKRRQYERGSAFFEHVADERGLEAAATAWTAPGNLPTPAELDRPEVWIRRVDP